MGVRKGCICEICECGRHKCPHNHNHTKACIESRTEYNNRYQKYDIQGRQESFKPKPQLIQDHAKLDDATTFKTDYIQHPLQAKPAAKGSIYEKPAGCMDMRTSYVNDYPQKPLYKTASTKQDRQYARDDIPFEGLPTYKDDYKAWEGVRCEHAKKDKMYVPPSCKLEDTTTFKSDYYQKNLPFTKSFKPDNMAMVSHEPFDDLTSHKMNYICHDMPERYRKPQADYCPSRVPLDSLTTAQRDYIGHELPKNESFKPKNTVKDSGCPLDDATEFKDAYKKWDIGQRQMITKDLYVKPPGLMDGMTSNKKDYIPHKLEMTRSYKPANTSGGNEAHFDDSTTFKTDYKPWQQSHQRRGDPSRKNYELPSVPFEGLPTYKAHYIEHELGPASSFKPDNFVDANHAPFEGNTMYNSEYTRKMVPVCPMSNPPAHGYLPEGGFTTQGHELLVLRK